MQDSDQKNSSAEQGSEKSIEGIEKAYEDQLSSQERAVLQELLQKLVNSGEHKSPSLKISEEKGDGLASDWIYENIVEVSKNCRKIYFLFLGLLAYALLAVFTTPVQHLFLSENVKLPIFNALVPLDYFLLIIPPFAIGLFIYKQLYLIKINRLIDYAIEECDNSNPNCEFKKNNECNILNCKKHQNRLYPWMIIFSRFGKGKIIGRLQRSFVILSIWCFLPLMLIVFSLFVVKKHDEFLSNYVLVNAFIGTGIVFAFWLKNKRTEIDGVEADTKNLKKLLKKLLGISKYMRGIALLLISLVVLGLLPKLNFVAKEGILWSEKDTWSDEINILSKILRSLTLADLSYRTLIKELEVDRKSKSHYSVDLENVRLEGANLAFTILSRANLRESRLKNANLVGTALDKVDLYKANINSAKLIAADLRGADLYMAELRRSDLSSARLQGANLTKADLNNADLEEAILRGANLANANLLYADLRRTEDITQDQLIKANNYKFALYSKEMLEILGLPKDHNRRVKEKNFADSVFTEANLKGADLRRANLRNAILKEADLQGADLRETKGITTKQLLDAKNYKLAFYNTDLLEKLKLPLDHNTRLKDKNLSDYDFRGTNLNNAELPGVNLQGAELQQAKLIEADLQEANLNEAKLQGAVLRGAKLQRVKLKDANLSGTNLKEANLKGANLQNAILKEADLQGADFRETKGVTTKQLLDAKNYKLAFYNTDLLEKLKLPLDHNTRLKDKNLSDYDFRGTNLNNAELPGVNLQGAELRQANLAEANLKAANLQSAGLQEANLVKADLREANLNIARLQKANLRNSKLSSANLKNAFLSAANLQEADLGEANLQEANLENADLQNAVLNNADFKDANLQGADFRKASLYKSDLQYADLRQAKGLTKDAITTAMNWHLAYYDQELIQILGLPVGHNHKVKKKDFRGYDFSNANLKGADLTKANLQNAILTEANLQWADLRELEGITKNQLLGARSSCLALYSEEQLKYFGLPSSHNTRVIDKDFSSYSLKGANLQGADLQKTNFKKADLREANLQQADLRGASLRESKLNKADLRRANLLRANLQYADLRHIIFDEGIVKAQLEKATNWTLAYYDEELIEILDLPEDHNARVKKKDFTGYSFTRANLKGAELNGAALNETVLLKADLREVDLNEANLKEANLDKANLTEAQLRQANLKGAYLGKADLREADLKGADLSEADLREADLRGANLREVDLCGANLRSADLRAILFSDLEQFQKVETLYLAKLDPGLMTQLENRFPSLFKKPVH